MNDYVVLVGQKGRTSCPPFCFAVPLPCRSNLGSPFLSRAGAHRALLAGLEVVKAANHWTPAVEVAKQNHPGIPYEQQDLQQANFYTWPDFDVMLASPCCQGHSKSRGKDRPHHDESRSTAWAVIACAEAKRPKAVVIENVTDFRDRWELYPLWRACLAKLGYRLSENVLNAADFGVPQDRERLFIVGVRRDLADHPIRVTAPNLPHVPARTILDPDAKNWSPILKPGRAMPTLRRILNGRQRLGVDRFLIPYYGSGSGKTGRSVDRPIGTVTTNDRYALVEPGRLRMLTPREYLRAQGFPEDYKLYGTKKVDVKLIGNAVPPVIPRHVLCLLNRTLAVSPLGDPDVPVRQPGRHRPAAAGRPAARVGRGG